ncbi:hypothetical protein MMC07_004412 [Pseudocyphellaria aurata]|nr:hypothetical protein [Pseudocyphellaria aurata]
MADVNPISALLIIIITILVPPVGVFLIAGCGADLFINICLTLLGYLTSPPRKDKSSFAHGDACARYFPGHIHAFYLEYIYFDRRDRSRLGNMTNEHAPGIYSDNVQRGGTTTYGTT